MKNLRITFLFGLLSLLFVFNSNPLQAQCSANFTIITGNNGLVNLYSTGGNGGNTTYYWYSNGVLTFSGTAAMGGTSTSISYTANGTYSISLTVVNSSPSCTNTVNQNVTITNATGCLLSANYSAVNAGAGLFNFSSTSTNTLAGSTYTWSFGDGSTGNGINPSHTYTNNGVYTVSLTVNNSGTCSASYSGNVSVCLSPVSAGFNYSIGLNGQVTFTSTSTPTGSTIGYNWSFINQIPGTYTTIGIPTATYTFPANGLYTVSLMSGVMGCTSSTTQNIFINNICNLNASFNYSSPSPGQVNFTGYSPGTNASTNYTWGFGDGGSGAGQSPVHTYTTPGVYNVTLTITNTGTCNATSTTTQNVQVCMMSSNFIYAFGNNGQINFYSTSTGTNIGTNYTWYLNGWQNPVTGVNMPMVSNTYSVNSTFTVGLEISNGPGCTFLNQQLITVSNVSCTANPNFSLVPTATPQVWNAIPASPANVVNAIWSWGDGSSSLGLFSSHTYSASANYNICLSVTVNCSSTASSCATYSVYRSNNSMIQIIVVDPSQIVGINTLPTEMSGINVFPNPSHGNLTIQSNNPMNGNISVSIYNLLGECVYTKEIESLNGNLKEEIKVESFSKGLYVLKLKNLNSTYTTKIMFDE